MPGRECYHCKQWIEEGEAHDCWTTTEAALTQDLSEDLQEASLLRGGRTTCRWLVFAAYQWRKDNVSVGLDEDGDAHPGDIFTCTPRECNPMHRRAQPPCGPKLQRIPDVDDNGVLQAWNVHPAVAALLFVREQDLQSPLVGRLSEE